MTRSAICHCACDRCQTPRSARDRPDEQQRERHHDPDHRQAAAVSIQECQHEHREQRRGQAHAREGDQDTAKTSTAPPNAQSRYRRSPRRSRGRRCPSPDRRSRSWRDSGRAAPPASHPERALHPARGRARASRARVGQHARLPWALDLAGVCGNATSPSSTATQAMTAKSRRRSTPVSNRLIATTSTAYNANRPPTRAAATSAPPMLAAASAAVSVATPPSTANMVKSGSERRASGRSRGAPRSPGRWRRAGSRHPSRTGPTTGSAARGIERQEADQAQTGGAHSAGRSARAATSLASSPR